MTWNLSDLQREVAPWQVRNFGADRPAYWPLLGIVEEIGELDDASKESDTIDACADVVVFMADLSNAMEFDLQALYELAAEQIKQVRRKSLTSSAGKLAHAFLKMEQGIRGTRDEHIHSMQAAIADILTTLMAVGRSHDFNLVDVTRATWANVSQRTWRCQADGCKNGVAYPGAVYCGAACAARSGA